MGGGTVLSRLSQLENDLGISGDNVTDYNDKIDNLRKLIEELNQELLDLSSKHDQDVLNINKNHEEDVKRLDNDISSLKTKHQQDVNRIDGDIQELESNHDQDITTVTNKISTTNRNLTNLQNNIKSALSRYWARTPDSWGDGQVLSKLSQLEDDLPKINKFNRFDGLTRSLLYTYDYANYGNNSGYISVNGIVVPNITSYKVIVYVFRSKGIITSEVFNVEELIENSKLIDSLPDKLSLTKYGWYWGEVGYGHHSAWMGGGMYISGNDLHISFDWQNHDAIMFYPLFLYGYK